MCVQGNLPIAGYYLYVPMRVGAYGVCATCLYTYTIIRIPRTGAPQDEPSGRSAGLGFAQGDRRAPSTVAAGDELPVNSQVPSAPSSSLCQEKTQRRPAKPRLSGFADPTTTRKPWCASNRVPLCLGYPVHRSLPPTRRSFTDENLVPREAQDKPLSPHANLSLLRAARMASKTLRLPAEVYPKPGPR